MVQAGVFDTFNKNRNSLFNSIPNIIIKSKNIHENKLLNQINLFEEEENNEDNFIINNEDWNTDIKLTKEFETLGFYISDHPLNQYRSIFDQYNITNYDEFENAKNILSSNVACTILKVQEKKTQKGNSYGIIKFSDLSNVFELFIFSEIFETNRNKLIEGNSVMLTLVKNYIDENKIQKRINVKKMVLLKELIHKPIKNITFRFNDLKEIEKLKNLSNNDGETSVNIIVNRNKKIHTFRLKNKRKVSYELLNLLNLKEYSIID